MEISNLLHNIDENYNRQLSNINKSNLSLATSYCSVLFIVHATLSAPKALHNLLERFDASLCL